MTPDDRARALYGQLLQDQAQWLEGYLQGAPEESHQFDFFLGTWNTETRLLNLDGSLLRSNKGLWIAKSVDEGRMIVDELHTYLPNGAVLEGSITLRTFSPQTLRWEMTFLISMQPLLVKELVGIYNDGEIQATAKGVDPRGNELLQKVRFYDITANSFEWELTQSWDGGESWYRIMTTSARRRSEGGEE